MDTYKELGAKVRSDKTCVIVDIDEADQGKAQIARLVCEFPAADKTQQTLDNSSPIQPERLPEDISVSTETGQGSLKKPPTILGQVAYLANLEKELHQNRELLEVTKNYFFKLKKRKAEQGFSFPIAQEIELEKYKEEIEKLQKGITDLEARIRQESKRPRYERRPYEV